MPQPSAQAPVETYSRTARALHWTTVVLLVLQFPVGLYMVYRGSSLNLWDNLTGALYSVHKLAGVTILIVVIWRLVYRTTRGAPADEPTIAPWQRIVSRLNHWGLYALLVAAPIAGYIGSRSSRRWTSSDCSRCPASSHRTRRQRRPSWECIGSG